MFVKKNTIERLTIVFPLTGNENDKNTFNTHFKHFIYPSDVFGDEYEKNWSISCWFEKRARNVNMICTPNKYEFKCMQKTRIRKVEIKCQEKSHSIRQTQLDPSIRWRTGYGFALRCIALRLYAAIEFEMIVWNQATNQQCHLAQANELFVIWKW